MKKYIKIKDIATNIVLVINKKHIDIKISEKRKGNVMKKKKIVSLLMAALMIGQFLPSETMTAFAGESALVGKEQLADRHTVAPKKIV